MNLRRIKHTLLRLTAEEKVIGIGSIAMLIGTFMPWYGVIMNFDKKSLTETGFSGDLGVIGFVIFILSIISLIVLVGENLHLPLPKFGYKREQILFFLIGESFFLTLITMAIYTKRSLEFTEAGLRFGIYLVLIGAFFGALSGFALIQKKKTKEVKEFFDHDKQDDDEPADEAENEADKKAVKEEMVQTEPEPMYFEEDARVIEDAKEVVATKASDHIEEDDMIEDIIDIPLDEETEPSKATKGDTEAKKAKSQADHFTREAGIEKEVKKPKSGNSMSMSFYDDE